MVVKSRRGRRRYIAFQVAEGLNISNEDILSALQAMAASHEIHTPKIIQFDGQKGIVRTSGEEKDRWVEALNHLPKDRFSFHLDTMAVSGTLLTLREKYFPTAREHR